MNVSGKGTVAAWKEFVSTNKMSDDVLGLVVLHDELEADPSVLKIRRGQASHRGHNGIKSVQETLKGGALMQELDREGRFVKVGLGIGRPESRDPQVVSEYVLGQITQKERMGIEGKVGELDGLLRREMERMGKL
jgi:peptidyl-tRNA hydrolase, PTH1 family